MYILRVFLWRALPGIEEESHYILNNGTSRTNYMVTYWESYCGKHFLGVRRSPSMYILDDGTVVLTASQQKYYYHLLPDIKASLAVGDDRIVSMNFT